MKNIVVYCGSNTGKDSVFVNGAKALGKEICQLGATLIYGGAKIGLMGCIADTVLESGGKVIGVIPKFLSSKEVAHDQITEIILVDTMHERKSKLYEMGDAFIAMPGGFGTFEELFEMLTWAQLGLHQKPIGVLNIDGYYDHLIAQISVLVQKGFVSEDNARMVLVASSAIELIEKMQNYVGVETKKWMEDVEQT